MMTPKPAPKTTKPKAQPTAHDPVIEVPPAWKLETEFGFMQAAGSPPVDLVRLATVLRWIETTQKIPRLHALTTLCDAMPEDIMNWLFWVQPGDYAKPVPVDCLFFEKSRLSDSPRFNESEHEYWISELYGGPRFGEVFSFRKHINPTEPGLTALKQVINTNWKPSGKKRVIEILDDPKGKYLTPLSISLIKAAEIWGYGVIAESKPESQEKIEYEFSAEFEALCKLRTDSGKKRFRYTNDHQLVMKSEKEKLEAKYGISCALALMAKKLGLGSPQAVENQIKQADESKKTTVSTTPMNLQTVWPPTKKVG